ncbi:DNRLRE domain-containing protein [Bacillaceae bacterium W0354]
MPTQTFKVGEMLNKRTRNSKTWINFDGSFTTEIYPQDIHFEDESGQFHNIDTDLQDEADLDVYTEPVSKESIQSFAQSRLETTQAKKKKVLNRQNHNFKALKVPFDANIPRNFQRGYSISKGTDKLTFKPVNSSPSYGELDTSDRSKVTYQDVWNDADVELKVLPNGIKETIYLKSNQAPTSFRFEVEGNIREMSELELAPAWLEDAEGTERYVKQEIVEEDEKTYIVLEADVTDLKYPIAVDPTVTTTKTNLKNGDTFSFNVPSNAVVKSANVKYTGGYLEDVVKQYTSERKRNLNPDSSQSTSTGHLQLNHNIPSGAKVTRLEMSADGKTRRQDTYASVGSYVEHTIENPDINGSIYANTYFSGGYNGVVDTSIRGKYAAYGPENDWVHGSYATVEQVVSLDLHVYYLVSLQNPSITVNGTSTGAYSGTLTNGQSTSNISISNVKAGTNNVTFNSTQGVSDLVISVNYNTPPTTPTVITPNGGEVWNAGHTIKWNASTDADGDNLTYQIQLSVNNGSTYKTIVSMATGTSYEYDFTNEPSTDVARIRIRAYDGTSHSGWDVSDGVFSIQHNQAPTIPTNLNPSGGSVRDRASNIRFSWQYNDPDPTDSQSKYTLRWRYQGTTTWNELTSVTPNNYHDFSGNTFNRQNVEWQVRTFDQDGEASPWSDVAVFFAGDKPVKPVITSNSEVNVSNPTITWSSSEQVTYELKVLQNGNELYSYNAELSKAHTIKYDLENNSIYTVELTITNEDGLKSDIETQTITVSYTQPATPILITEKELAGITLNINNPSPSGTEPTVTHNNVYRREQGGDWKRIATNVLTTFTDYTVASGKTYEYYVRAWGDNETYSDSDVVDESITFKGVWLHDVTDPTTLHNFRADGDGRTNDWRAQATHMKFAGRKYQVTEFSEHEDDVVNVNLKMFREWEDYNALNIIIKAKNTVCYRDGRGRKIFGTIIELPVNDTVYGYDTSIQVTATSYSEEV